MKRALVLLLAACSEPSLAPVEPAHECRLPAPVSALSCNESRCIACFADLTCRRFAGRECPELAP